VLNGISLGGIMKNREKSEKRRRKTSKKKRKKDAPQAVPE